MNLLFNTLFVSLGATLLALGAGFAVALWASGHGSRGRACILTGAIVCLALPPFLAANCWLELTSSSRLAWGAAQAATAYLPLTAVVLAGLTWPLVALLILGAWSRLERGHLEALPGLRGTAIVRVLLWPTARPALGAAGVLTLALAAGNFAVPTLFQVRVLPEEMWIRLSTQLDTAGAWRAGLPLIAVSAIALPWLGRHPVSWPQWRGGATGAEWQRGLGWVWWVAAALGLGTMALSGGLPLFRLLASARTWQELAGAVGAGGAAIRNSLVVAAGTASLVSALAILAAWGRVPRWILKPAVALFLVPGILPASLWIPLLNRSWLHWLYDSLPVLWLVLGIRYAGVAAVYLQSRGAAADRTTVEALRVAGAGPVRAWWSGLWPQLAGAAGWIWYAVFLLSLWDVESIILVQPPGGETLAVRIFNLLHYGHAGQVNALCLVLLGVALLPLPGSLGWRAWQRRGWVSGGVAVTGVVLLTGCSPVSEATVNPLNSRWFSQVQVIGSRGVAPGQFNKPRSVACDREDNLFVCDVTGRIQKFDSQGHFLLQWQMPQTDLGKAKGMALDPFGNVLVVEPHYMRVNHFSPDGRLVAQWGVKGTNVGQFILPRSIGVTSKGEYLVSEYTVVDRVQRFSAFSPATNGSPAVLPRFLQAWGEPGIEPGRFNRAEGLGVGVGDQIFVADSCNHRIQVFNADGRFLRTHGRAGTNPGEFSYPYDVRVDAQGNQFVCEFGNSRITILDAQDRVVEVVGGPGSAPGRFANPWALAFDSHGNLYVADSQNHRVQKLIRRTAPPARS